MSGHKPFSEIRRGDNDPVRRARVQAIKAAMVDAQALAELREHRGSTQVAIAEAMSTIQSSVSRLERRDDLYLSTIRGYVEAMGGELALLAVFEDEIVALEPRTIAVTSKAKAGNRKAALAQPA